MALFIKQPQHEGFFKLNCTADYRVIILESRISGILWDFNFLSALKKGFMYVSSNLHV